VDKSALAARFVDLDLRYGWSINSGFSSDHARRSFAFPILLPGFVGIETYRKLANIDDEAATIRFSIPPARKHVREHFSSE
jgi:hypothetical protein